MVVNLQDRLPLPEHMEEESHENPIPPWVELEYTVRLNFFWLECYQTFYL
jgi:hypothetical protein